MESFLEKFNRKKQRGSTTIPYSALFIQFIKESREQQTIQANLAGNLMSEFNINNRKKLEDFLSINLYNFKFSEGRKNYTEHKKQENIQKIADKIFESFPGVDTVQLTLIWIFCYSPDEEQTIYLPLFLIKSQNRLVSKYMDTKFRYFNTWKHLIENVNVGKSFLCFPREGKYQSNESVLDLEFMWSRTAYKVSQDIKIYVPFCISYVKNWFTDKIQSSCKTVSKTWTKAIEFYKAHSSKINFTIHIILIIAAECIYPSPHMLQKLISLLKPMLEPSVQTNDGTDSTCIADPRSQEEFLNKFEKTCNNTVAFSQLCINAYKNQTFKDTRLLLEKLCCISRDVMEMSNNKIVSSLLEKITKITIKQSEKCLENVRIDAPIGNGLAKSCNLSASISNKEYEKYTVHMYHGSDFTEAQNTALCLFKRDLKFDKKSNKLFDCSKNLLGYIFFLPNVTVCMYLKSEIQSNESENYTFTNIED